MNFVAYEEKSVSYCLVFSSFKFYGCMTSNLFSFLYPYSYLAVLPSNFFFPSGRETITVTWLSSKLLMIAKRQQISHSKLMRFSHFRFYLLNRVLVGMSVYGCELEYSVCLFSCYRLRLLLRTQISRQLIQLDLALL